MSTQSKILAPHKEQNGWRYVRVRSDFATHDVDLIDFDYANEESELIRIADNDEEYTCLYNDNAEGSRVISSRRVEEAVETADYLKRCNEDGYAVFVLPKCFRNEKSWYVTGFWEISWRANIFTFSMPRRGKTLREAYWRYKNLVAAND